MDPEQTQAISNLPTPSSKKEMQSFLGKIIFSRCFVPSFSEMVRPLQNMIKKDVLFKWGPQENLAFNSIRKSIIEAPSLMSPDFSKDFTMYTFASDRSYVVVLTQKNVENNEVPISFMSYALKGEELNYLAVDQQDYVVFKAVKHFRPYQLKSRVKFIVPYPVVRNLLVQKELGEKSENWMTSLQEYDIEIVPARIVRGQGLCKLVVDSVEIPENQSTTPTENMHNETQIYCVQNKPGQLLCLCSNFYLFPFDLAFGPISLLPSEKYDKHLLQS